MKPARRIGHNPSSGTASAKGQPPMAMEHTYI
jgi:hypothetical protein